MKVKPGKLKVSGFPSPRRARRSAAKKHFHAGISNDPMVKLLLELVIGGMIGLGAKISTGLRGTPPYILLGIGGAFVGTRIVDAMGIGALGSGAIVGPGLGAAFLVIGRRQTHPPQ